MSEKSILFNTDMVKAILDGRKTQTRRPCKGQPQDSTTSPDVMGYKPPYHAGDILWVRETWRPVRYRRPERAVPVGFTETGYEYMADGIARSDGKPEKWRPSIHMPREAARLFLRVTSVRVQRLQDITSGEAVAEGIKSNLRNPSEAADALIAFEELWNSTLKPADLPLYGWGANPWVWVIGFVRIEK